MMCALRPAEPYECRSELIFRTEEEEDARGGASPYGRESLDWFNGVWGALADINWPPPGRAKSLLSLEPAECVEDLLPVEPTDSVEGVNEARDEGLDWDMNDGTGGVRLETGTRKGCEIVVTRMAFFSNAFSLVTSASEGIKFRIASNGVLSKVAR
jgi:hypothetical protein